MDVLEIDAASNNGVDNVRDLRDDAIYTPSQVKMRVYIVDEVHMLSISAFNALLKIIEEPPEHLMFILATTELHKVPATILSRCQRFSFRRISQEDIAARLQFVAYQENIDLDESAARVLARLADGGMRDALSIFDQVASFCQGDITLEKVIKDLNLMDIEHYFQLTDLSLQNKCADVMLLLNSMLEQGMDAGHVVTGFAEHIRNVMMAKDQQTIPLLETSAKYAQRYAQQAQACPPAFLYKALQILTRCDLNYRQSSNKRLLVEITLIEVAQITQPADADGVPRKGRMLKNLFEKLAPLKPKTAEQAAVAYNKPTVANEPQPSVAASVSTVASAVSSATVSAEGAKPSVSKPVLNMGSGMGSLFGSTFKSLGKTEDQAAQIDEVVEEANKEVSRFTTEELNHEWLAMCIRMGRNQTMRGLASSLRNCPLEMKEYPNVEIIVTNNILLDQIKAIQGRIKATLSQSLHNSEITIAVRLAENHEVKKVLTKFELYEKLYNELPSLQHLVRSLGLELVSD
jgi:DNA polymerase-3 subunit gamma/tau